MNRISDYMDRWRTATPVIRDEIEVEYIPLYPKDPGLPGFKLRETGEPEEVTKLSINDEGFVEVPTLENLLKRLEKLEAIIKGMKK